MVQAVVELTEVTKHYQLGKTIIQALRGVTLEIEGGEFVCIAGPSGSGKTTLLNLIGCLDKPTSGRVEIEGREITDLSAYELAQLRRHKIGFIFQTFNLIPVLSAYENVELPLFMKDVHISERSQRVRRVLEALGLEKLTQHRPDELSGGQQQRVAIARALVTDPVIVLADEPTANLDSETGKVIIELMHQMNQQNETTFIFSTHDPKVMERASRVVNLKDGLIVN